MLARLPDSFFLTGTDTGVGKTHVAAAVVRGRRANGRDCVGMKPFCCGDRDDAEQLFQAAGGTVPINDINPIWLRTPAAPYVASLVESRPLDLSLLFEAYERLRRAHSGVVVEGVGGWRVPILQDFAVSDLAVRLGLPVVIVAANRLGALNHTILTVESVQACGAECAGVILNDVSAPGDHSDVAATTNAATLEQILAVPILATVSHRGSAGLA